MQLSFDLKLTICRKSQNPQKLNRKSIFPSLSPENLLQKESLFLARKHKT